MRKLGHRNFNFPEIIELTGAGFSKPCVSGLSGLGVGETDLMQRLRKSNPIGLISPQDNRRKTVANRQFPDLAWAVSRGRSYQISQGYANGIVGREMGKRLQPKGGGLRIQVRNWGLGHWLREEVWPCRGIRERKCMQKPVLGVDPHKRRGGVGVICYGMEDTQMPRMPSGPVVPGSS